MFIFFMYCTVCMYVGVLGLPELHRLADGIGCCTVNVFRPGDEQGWHYDETEFSVTLMLAEAEKMLEITVISFLFMCVCINCYMCTL